MNNFDNAINGEVPVLVDFFATWCGPCQMMPPILKEVKAQLGDAVRILKIDVDKNQSLAAKYQVRGVPALQLFKKGERVWNQAGVVPAHELTATIKQFI